VDRSTGGSECHVGDFEGRENAVGGANLAPNDTGLAGRTVKEAGTTSDMGSDVVAGVEVATNGGATWHAAPGHGSWSRTSTPAAAGTLFEPAGRGAHGCRN
jgi:hypothetical protein